MKNQTDGPSEEEKPQIEQQAQQPLPQPKAQPQPQAEQPKPQKENRSFFERLLSRGGAKPAGEDRSRKQLMRKFRRAKDIPDETGVERFTPSLEEGLSEEQVETRNNQFLFNDVNKKYSKSYPSIFIGNICTVFNLLCVIVAAALIYARAPLAQFLFVLIFSANLVIGIIQEIIAKRQIDKLAVLISATAKVMRGGVMREISIKEIVLDDVLLLEPGQQIPADCILESGSMEVNESLLTGESASVKKTDGDTLYAGSYVVSGTCYVRADKVGKSTYLNVLTSKAKKYKRPKSEIMNSIRLFIRVIGLLIPIIAGLTFWVNWSTLAVESEGTFEQVSSTIQYTGAVVIGMIPSGLLLLTSFAMAIGIGRLARKQTLVQDMYSLEMLARVNVLCLDKTGTITDGRMTVSDCMILASDTEYSVEQIMSNMLSALDDNNHTSQALADRFGRSNTMRATEILPFSSKRKLSAVTFGNETYVFGAPEFVLRPMPQKIDRIVKQYAQIGLRVLVLARGEGKIKDDAPPSSLSPLALITLADNIRPEAVETIKWFKENDVDIRIISGDNPVTVSEVAKRVGVKDANKYISLDGLTDMEVENIATQYTVFGRVTPEQKAILVRTIKRAGNTVAMTGDGVNDILALKEADCAISVASGSEAARNVSHLVLMNNNFLNLPSVVYEGRRIINNIKNSSSLYIMKSLFTAMLAMICVIMHRSYFFTTNNLLLFEFFVAMVPSVIISLQPNTDRVKGKFILYVISRSLPGAITLILCVMSVYLGCRYLPEELGTVTFLPEGGEAVQLVTTRPLLVPTITFAGIVMLYQVLKPLNFIRASVFFGCLAICIIALCLPYTGNIFYSYTVGGKALYTWSEISFSLTQILYLLVVMLAAFPVSSWLTKACDLLNTD